MDKETLINYWVETMSNIEEIKELRTWLLLILENK